MSSICTPEVLKSKTSFSSVQMRNKILNCTWIDKDAHRVHCFKPSSDINKDAYNDKKVIVKLGNLTGEDCF